MIVVLSVVYSYLMLKGIGDFSADSFSTLANVKALFQNDDAVAGGWLHYLAFDLFVGAYIVRKVRHCRFPAGFIQFHFRLPLCLVLWGI